MSGLMLFSLLIGGVVVLAALAAHDAQRAANRTVRWVWFSAMGVIVVLSLAAPFRQASSPMRVSMPEPSTVADGSMLRANAPPRWQALWSRARDAVSVPVEAGLQVVASTLDRVPVRLERGLAVAWLVASIVTMTAFVVSYVRIRRAMRRWPVQRVDHVTARIAPAAGPAVVGLAPSEIILPAWLLKCPPAEQQMVVVHESEHVRAGDPWLLVIACGMVAFMPWHPALWFALGRLRLAIELDCDRRVLRRGVPSAAYGSLLIELSALRAAFPSAIPAFSCNGSYLERRLVAMTSHPSRFSRSRRAAGAVVACAALVAACETTLPSPSETNDSEVAAAQLREATLTLAGQKDSVMFFVDSKLVSREYAQALMKSQLTNVSVVHSRDNAWTKFLVSTRGSDLKVKRVPVDSSTVFAKAPTESKRTFDGLLIVDGRVTDARELDRINPATIANVEVLKRAVATRAFSDPRAANGVIKVTTKVVNR